MKTIILKICAKILSDSHEYLVYEWRDLETFLDNKELNDFCGFLLKVKNGIFHREIEKKYSRKTEKENNAFMEKMRKKYSGEKK